MCHDAHSVSLLNTVACRIENKKLLSANNLPKRHELSDSFSLRMARPSRSRQTPHAVI
jgi:hypothetical protein